MLKVYIAFILFVNYKNTGYKNVWKRGTNAKPLADLMDIKLFLEKLQNSKIRSKLRPQNYGIGSLSTATILKFLVKEMRFWWNAANPSNIGFDKWKPSLILKWYYRQAKEFSVLHDSSSSTNFDRIQELRKFGSLKFGERDRFAEKRVLCCVLVTTVFRGFLGISQINPICVNCHPLFYPTYQTEKKKITFLIHEQYFNK